MKLWKKILIGVGVVLGIIIIILVTAFFVIDGCTDFVGNVIKDVT